MRFVLTAVAVLLVSCSGSSLAPTVDSLGGRSLLPGEGHLELDFADVPTCEQRTPEGICAGFRTRFELVGATTQVGFITGPGGAYQVRLPAGTYQLRPADDQHCVSPHQLQIRAGDYHRTDVLWPVDCASTSSDAGPQPPESPPGPAPTVTPPPRRRSL